MALSKGPGDDEVEVWKLSRELQAIQNATDGPFSERDKKRIQVIETILNAEPDLRKTLVNLDIRQRKEEAQAIRDGRFDMDLLKRHEDERKRYTREYGDAKAIREGMEKQERRETLEHGIDPDKPKLSR